MQFPYLSINHNTIITASGLRSHTIFSDELGEQCASEVGAAIYATSGGTRTNPCREACFTTRLTNALV